MSAHGDFSGCTCSIPWTGLTPPPLCRIHGASRLHYEGPPYRLGRYEFTPNQPEVKQGWQCPKCQRIHAPRVSGCGECNKGARQ